MSLKHRDPLKEEFLENSESFLCLIWLGSGCKEQEIICILRTFALIVSAHPYCTPNSRCNVMPPQVPQARKMSVSVTQ